MTKICSADECARKTQSRGLCSTHYSYWHRAQKKYPKVCGWCNVVFDAPRHDAMYCSIKCVAMKGAVKSKAARLDRDKGKYLPVLYTGPRGRTFEMVHTKGSRLFTSGRCRVCQTGFVSLHQEITCSAECKSAYAVLKKREAKDRRRAIKRQAFVSNVNRDRVYRSDGFKCHICNKKLDMTKTVPHPMAPTLDHVVPLAKGGTHEPSNCRAAHFLCNSLKGQHGHGDQMLLLSI